MLNEKTWQKMKIEIINEKIIENLDFDCENEDLNDFIHNDALKHLNEKLAVTYLCMIDETVLGFVSIANASTKIDEKHKKEIIFQYSEFTAVKLGRLGIDKRYKGNGIGTCLVK